MGFMVPVAEHFVAYRDETTFGTELVPEDVCGSINASAVSLACRSALLLLEDDDELPSSKTAIGGFNVRQRA